MAPELQRDLIFCMCSTFFEKYRLAIDSFCASHLPSTAGMDDASPTKNSGSV